MIKATCDKCGRDVTRQYGKDMDGIIANAVKDHILCEQCRKEWYKINNGLENKVFQSFIDGDIQFLKSSKPAKMRPDGYNNHDGSYYACPFCGKTYNGWTLKKNEVFECPGCFNDIVWEDTHY